jgi:ankyrin repeat protein
LDSLLMLASYHGHLATSRALLARGADPALANDRGQTPLAGAAFKSDVAMASLLLDHGAAVGGAGPDGRTLLLPPETPRGPPRGGPLDPAPSGSARPRSARLYAEPPRTPALAAMSAGASQ